MKKGSFFLSLICILIAFHPLTSFTIVHADEVVEPGLHTDWRLTESSITPPSPKSGELVSFQAAVGIVSLIDPLPQTVDVALYLDGELYFSTSLTFTQPLDVITIQTDWTATGGEHSVKWVVDPNLLYEDSDPENNVILQTLTVEEIHGEIISADYPLFVKPNGNLTIAGTFQYSLPSLSGVAIRLHEAEDMPIGPDDPALDSQEFALQGEGTQSFTLSTDAPPSEMEWNLVVTLWVSGVTEWLFQDKYVFTITVRYTPPVEILSFTLSNYEPVDGELVTVTAELAVTGYVAGEELPIQFEVDGVIVYGENITLPPAELYVYNSSFEWTAVEGSHSISVEVWESTEEIDVTVGPAPPPVTFEIPWWVWVGGIALITATIGLIVVPRLTYAARRTCKMSYKWMFQTMDLNVYPKDKIRALSDDPMPLKALAYDRHVLIQECHCAEDVSRKNHILSANVRYEWEIIDGEGGFVKINDGEESKKEVGEQVLYQPPNIEDPKETKKVTIRVTAHHDDETKPPRHDPCVLTWDIEIKREVKESGPSSENNTEFTDPGEVTDEYVYTLTVRNKRCPKPNALLPQQKGECLPENAWNAGSPVDGKIVLSPAEAAYGDYVVFRAEGMDTDRLILKCTPKGEKCIESSMKELDLNDLLEYKWGADKGSFPRGSNGREVVWQAPDEEGKVKIKLKIRDVGKQYDDKDKELETVIVVRKLGIDLVKTPKTWNTTSNLTLSDLTLELPARIYICKDNKWVYPGRKKLIRLKLKKVSRERGVCMNYPRNGNLNPDLFFNEEKISDDYIFSRDKTVANDCPTEVLAPNDNPAHKHHYLYTISKHRRAEAKPTIRCEDYGPIGFLEAKANHCVQIPPRDTADEEPCARSEGCCTGPNEVKMPRDENGNDIADAAPQDDGGGGANRDQDNTPAGDGTRGDGLTNYEEYRGFIVGGQRMVPVAILGRVINVQLGRPKRHIRTNTRNKDTFIYDQNFMGTGFLNQTGLTIHEFYLEDLFDGTGSRVINFNRGRHTGGAQHGLWLRDSNMPGLYGMSCPVLGATNGPPRTKTHVCINRSLCTAAGEPANRLSNTIAHELAHGLNVWHHGEGDNHNCGGLSTNRTGRVTCGVENCIMRYDQYAAAWCHRTPHHRHSYVNPATGTSLDNPGTTYCNSSNATGLNDAGAGHRNPATRGNCLGQVRVKDW